MHKTWLDDWGKKEEGERKKEEEEGRKGTLSIHVHVWGSVA